MTFTKDYIDFGGSVFTFENIAKLPETKDNAFLHSVRMTCRAWTFSKLTQAEKESCIEAMRFANVQGLVTGNYKQRRFAYNAIYHAFLLGCGYNNSFNWRDNACC